jgi:hypothetical protein
MNPFFHAQSSVRLWGGKIEAYQPVHDWLDQTKECFADCRHRAIRHHSQGIYEAERVFGHAIDNGHGKMVPVRMIAEQHIREDCGGRIPTVADWLSKIPKEPWMNRGYKLEPVE